MDEATLTQTLEMNEIKVTQNDAASSQSFNEGLDINDFEELLENTFKSEDGKNEKALQ
jgi:hypothetical protein